MAQNLTDEQKEKKSQIYIHKATARSFTEIVYKESKNTHWQTDRLSADGTGKIKYLDVEK